MNVQATLITLLLVGLVTLSAISEWRAWNAAPAAIQPEFSVTSVAEGQYVMRADDKIFYCVNNRCTGIQLIAVPQNNGARTPAPENGED